MKKNFSNPPACLFSMPLLSAPPDYTEEIPTKKKRRKKEGSSAQVLKVFFKSY